MLEQDFEALGGVVGGRGVDGRAPLLVASVDLRTGPQQHLGRLGAVGPSSHLQRAHAVRASPLALGAVAEQHGANVWHIERGRCLQRGCALRVRCRQTRP